MKKLFFPCLIFCTLCYGESSIDLLVKSKDKLSQNSVKRNVYQIDLSDPFLVQAFGKMKSLNIGGEDKLHFMNQFFKKDYKEALKSLLQLKNLTHDEASLVRSMKSYIYWKENLSHEFFKTWAIEVTEYHFLNSELGVALDQVIAKNASSWLIEKGILISAKLKEQILKVESEDSKFLKSVKGYLLLKTGEKALSALKNLDVKDPLVLPLAKTVVTDLAVQGRLADAGLVVKEFIEPYLKDVDDVDLISEYYILLGRLLYQAKAYQQAKSLYLKVPDESSLFLQARLEALWISTIFDDISTTLGEVKSLEHFDNKFLPERYLMSSMAYLKLCEFDHVKESFDKYIKTNKEFSTLISTNLASDNPTPVEQKSLFRKIYTNALKTLELEISYMNKNKFETSSLLAEINLAKQLLKSEIKLEWNNKQKLIEYSLRKMRFVKIEFLSTMRRLSHKLATSSHTDQVTQLTSAIDKTDKLEFPYDGILFGDELFHMHSKIKALCLGEKRDN